MTTGRHISPVRPEADETLMSFLRRAQHDAGYSEEGFNNLLAGAAVPDSRRAERRDFDWWTLSRFFNATPDELHAMSERSIFFGLEDGIGCRNFSSRAPWTQAVGYGAHSPSALQTQEHWRKSWLAPGAIICREHKTVLVRHCHGCGGELNTMIWKRPTPVCPSCYAHLALGPIIPANNKLTSYAAELESRYDGIVAAAPANRDSHELAYFAVLWRAARLLRNKWRFAKFRWTFAEEIGVGPYAFGLDVAQRAISHAQSIAMVYMISEMEPTMLEHCWLLAGSREALESADGAVLLKLTEFAEKYTGRKFPEAAVRGQTTISLASWPGWKSIPKAA